MTAYETLTRREAQLLDFVMLPGNAGRGWQKRMSAHLGISEGAIRTHFYHATLKYGIHGKRWSPSVRLVYLRAKELGLV